MVEKIKKQAGFTLIELVVVMALMTLLASLASWGILSWKKNSEWLKDEGYAKITFLAAKSALSNKEAGNTLDEFIEQVKEEGTCVSTLKNLPKDYLGEDIDDRIYYLSAKKGEYLDYCKGKTVSNQARLLFDLLDSSMEEDSALNGAIVLEIDVKAGQVYSIFVGTWADSFTYQFLQSGERGDISITGDSEYVSAKEIREDVNYRKEHVFGYYTSGGVGEVASLSPKKIKVTSLEIENGETLDLKFSSNSTLQNWDVVYKIDIYSKDLLFTIKLRGIDYQKGYDGIANLEVGNETYQFPLTYDGITYTLTLDAMVSSQVMQLHTNFKEIDTFSITRFLKEDNYLDNIYATVQAQPFEVDENSAVRTDEAYKKFISEFGAFDYVTEEPKKSEEVCALYSKIDQNVELTTWRHLNNIRYYTKKKSKTTFQLLENLDWKDVILYELRIEDGSPVRLKRWEKSAQFPTIETNFYKEWIFDGNDKTIQNLELGGLSSVSYGADNKLEFKNQATALAIFKTNDGIIQNLHLKNCKVYSELDTTNTVALLCSTNSGTIQEVSIDNQTSMNAIVKESKQSGMGSIVGVNTDSGVVENCVNEGMVEAEGSNVGGLIGINQGKILYSQEQSIPSVIGVGNVGGLVGFNDKDAEIELQSKLLIGKIIATGDNVGGFIGKNLSAEIFKNSIEVACTSIHGGKNVGGVIGENSIEAKEAITIQASTAKGAITALDHVGGIIGSQEGLAIIKDSTNRMEITATNEAGGILGSVEVKDDEAQTSTQSSKEQIEVIPGGTDIPPIEVEVEYKIEISNVKNYGKISSEAGLIGGIIAKLPEESRILESTNYADLSCKGGTLGGICGINDGGSIESCKIGFDKLELDGQNIGGLAGTNIGTISECKVGDKIQFHTEDTDNLGGMVVQNQGIIKDSTAEVDFKDVQSVKNLGGIVAVNTFEVNNSTYTGSILGKDIGTMGGIVGTNEGGILECSVELENVSIDSGTVGAIAGRNNRSIETSTLISKKEAKIKVQKGLLGGIVGVNNGTITNCGASKSWEFIGNTLNLLEADITHIPDFTNDASLDVGSYTFEIGEGALGGIVAENGREGSIKQCITGRNWKLTGGEICAGVIGINKSGEENSSLVNQAQVVDAGIVGRQEASNSSILEKCYNLGKVENKDGKAAGIISTMRYSSTMIRNCRNYGQVMGTTSAAGIATAQFLSVQFSGCVNLGTITSENKAAGIALDCGTSFVNCHNFGTISGESVIGIANAKAYFTQCANFGKLDSNNTVYAITNQEVGMQQCKYTMSIYNKEEIPLTPQLTQSLGFNFMVDKEFKDFKEAYGFYVDYIAQESTKGESTP